jgi:hypothetical protein
MMSDDHPYRRTVIIPNHVHDAINAKLDELLALVPDAAQDRDIFYDALLEYFDNHGVIPTNVSLVKKAKA